MALRCHGVFTIEDLLDMDGRHYDALRELLLAEQRQR